MIALLTGATSFASVVHSADQPTWRVDAPTEVASQGFSVVPLGDGGAPIARRRRNQQHRAGGPGLAEPDRLRICPARLRLQRPTLRGGVRRAVRNADAAAHRRLRGECLGSVMGPETVRSLFQPKSICLTLRQCCLVGRKAPFGTAGQRSTPPKRRSRTRIASLRAKTSTV